MNSNSGDSIFNPASHSIKSSRTKSNRVEHFELAVYYHSLLTTGRGSYYRIIDPELNSSNKPLVGKRQKTNQTTVVFKTPQALNT